MKILKNRMLWVNGEELLALLFSEDSRPTMRWLYRMVQHRNIPFRKVGGMVLFDPIEVHAFFEDKKVTPKSKKRSVPNGASSLVDAFGFAT